jgi:hypothetical protein
MERVEVRAARRGVTMVTDPSSPSSSGANEGVPRASHPPEEDYTGAVRQCTTSLGAEEGAEFLFSGAGLDQDELKVR